MRYIPSSFLRTLILCLPLLLVCAIARADLNFTQNLGSIQGTVTDSSGAVVPETTITITNEAGQVLTVTANSEGFYKAEQLKPGRYTVKAELRGFASLLHQEVRVQIGETATVNIHLKRHITRSSPPPNDSPPQTPRPTPPPRTDASVPPRTVPIARSSAPQSAGTPPRKGDSAGHGVKSAEKAKATGAEEPTSSAASTSEAASSQDGTDLHQGQWAFVVPETMTQGVPETAIVRVAFKDIGNEIKRGLSGDAQAETLTVSRKMQVILSAKEPDAFIITPGEHDTQVIEGLPFAQWEWTVTPIKRGPHTLNIKVFALTKDKSEEVTGLPITSRDIVVRVSYKYLFKKYGGPLIGITLLLGLLVGGWRFTLKRIARNRETIPTIAPVPARPKTIRILYFSSNPSGTDPLRLDREYRTIDERLRAAEFRDLFDLREQAAARVGDLQTALLRYKPDIVHFSGHGSAKSEIVLEDNNGHSQTVPAEALSDLFSILHDNVRCVVLNACYSEHQAQAIAANIECVVGMSKAITDDAAINFAASFYQALGYGRDIKTAFDLGCDQINLEDLEEEDTPKILALKGDPKKLVFIPPANDNVGEST